MADDDGRLAENESLRQRLDEIEKGYKQRADQNHELIRHLTSRTFVILAVMVAIFFAGTASVTILQVRKIDKAEQATSLANAIQQQRRDATLGSCLDTNMRNVNAVDQLRAASELAKRGASPARSKLIDQSLASSILIIDALVPHQNCKQRVNQVAPPTH